MTAARISGTSVLSFGRWKKACQPYSGALPGRFRLIQTLFHVSLKDEPPIGVFAGLVNVMGSTGRREGRYEKTDDAGF